MYFRSYPNALPYKLVLCVAGFYGLLVVNNASFPVSGVPRKLRPKQRRKTFTRYWRHGQIRSVLSRHLRKVSMFESWNIHAKMMATFNEFSHLAQCTDIGDNGKLAWVAHVERKLNNLPNEWRDNFDKQQHKLEQSSYSIETIMRDYRVKVWFT